MSLLGEPRNPGLLRHFWCIYRGLRSPAVVKRYVGNSRFPSGQISVRPVGRRVAARIAWRQARLARSVW